MRKAITIHDLNQEQVASIEKHMLGEMRELDYKHPLRSLFLAAWSDFRYGKFSYDGATFSKSRYGKDMIFELAAFIHDWRNHNGYVSYKVDEEMFSIMIILNYPLRYIIQRRLLTIFTFLNIFRHFIKGTLRKGEPYNLYLL